MLVRLQLTFTEVYWKKWTQINFIDIFVIF